MTRSEHIAWAKERAREHLKAGDLVQAFASFVSDMSKHPETAKQQDLPANVERRRRITREIYFGKLTEGDLIAYIEGFL